MAKTSDEPEYGVPAWYESFTEAQYQDFRDEYVKALVRLVGLAEACVSTSDDSETCTWPTLSLNLAEAIRDVLVELDRITGIRQFMPTGEDGRVPKFIDPAFDGSTMAYSEAMRDTWARWNCQWSLMEGEKGLRWFARSFPSPFPSKPLPILPRELALLRVARELASVSNLSAKGPAGKAADPEKVDGQVVPLVLGKAPDHQALVLTSDGWQPKRLTFEQHKILSALRNALHALPDRKMTGPGLDKLRIAGGWLGVIKGMRADPILKFAINPTGKRGDRGGYYIPLGGNS